MNWIDLSLRLVAALAAGLALGLEREWRGHVAGLRTHVLVAVGSALFTLAGAYGFADIVGATQADPARIAAQVASGIGFIGAGAILRDGATIKGLTTAATLWLAASVGVMAGVGNYALLAIGTGLVLVTLVGLPYIKPSRWAAKREIAVSVSCQLASATLPAVLAALRTSSAEIGDIDVDVDKKRQRRTFLLTAHVPRRFHRESLIQRISAIPEVRKVSVNFDDEE
jgi:putative Mg2+ transporter-C (MgtC) family protein